VQLNNRKSELSLSDSGYELIVGLFCIWSSPKPNDTIANSEQYEVAYCTQPGHGARLIPPGSITGAQWLYAPKYIQVVGYINQSQVSLFAGDEGGGESAKFYECLFHG